MGLFDAISAYTPGALGNNPMARGYQALPESTLAAAMMPSPKWMDSLMALGSGISSALMAPGNAMMGNYNQVGINPDGSTTQFDPRMAQDASTLANMTTLGAGAMPADANALNMGIRAYHGSPHSFDQFDMSKIGTGEGAQSYGHGLYFAGNENVAQMYRDKLSQPATGSVYTVDLNAEPSQLLDWDKPISQQPKALQDLIALHLQTTNAERVASASAAQKMFPNIDWTDQGVPQQALTGAQAYELLEQKLGKANAATTLRAAGVPGIQYLDAGSRPSEGGTRNYVMFDDRLINVVKKYMSSGT